MPRFTQNFTNEELDILQQAVKMMTDSAERQGEEEFLAKLEALNEKLGDWM